MKKLISTFVHSESSSFWSTIPDQSAIQTWTDDLKRVIKSRPLTENWQLAGQAVVLETDENSNARELIHFVAGEVGMQLHIIDMPNVISNFPEWFAVLPDDQPAIVYLEPGSWQGDDFYEVNPKAQRFDIDEEQLRVFRCALKTLLKEELPSKPVVLVTVAQTFEQLDISFRQADAFDRRIQVPSWTDEGFFNAFADGIGRDKLGTSITEQKEKIACLLRDVYPDQRRRLLMQRAMQRVAWREKRQLEYQDLVYFASYGTGEVGTVVHPPNERHRHAVHEAGHALIGHLTSRERTAPALCSILPRNDSQGIVIPAYEGHERKSNDLSYKDMQYKIRVMLAGRAAEHFVLGVDEVSASGSGSDLENATKLANSMFALWGLSDDIRNKAAAAKNLAVIVGEASPSEAQHIETMTRMFLKRIYLETLAILRTNRIYLESIVDALVKRNFLVQKELEEIYSDIQARG